MGSEFVTGMQTSSSSFEQEIKIVIPGDINSIRTKLSGALEKLGYSVIEEQPLFARRGARNGGITMISADVLEYPINLHIGLKTTSEGSVLATFLYSVKNPMVGQGDINTLCREAEAICALARQTFSISNCPKCSTELTSDSRFCRRCGSSVTAPDPPELEILRLTAKSMAAYEFVRMAAVLITIAMAFLLVADIYGLSAKLVNVFRLLGFIFTPSLLLLFHGMRLLKKVVRPEPRQQESTKILQARPLFANTADANSTANATAESKRYKTGEMAALPPMPPPSITEHTTDLLNRQPDPVPVRREREKY